MHSSFFGSMSFVILKLIFIAKHIQQYFIAGWKKGKFASVFNSQLVHRVENSL